SILQTEGVFRQMRAARWAKGPKHSIAPSPGVDAGTLLAAARRGRRDGAERGHYPLPRLGRVDHVVDLEVRRVADGLPVLVHARDHLLEERLAGRRILDGGQLLSVAELHRALEPHAAELARRPGDGEDRRFEAAARPRLRAEPVSLAQHDG